MAKRMFVSQKAIKVARNFIIFLIVLVIAGMALIYLQSSYDSPEEFATEIESFGALGPFLVILLITLEVIVAPIPGFIVAIASGFAFGAVWGTVYTYIGNVLGTGIAFYLSRRFGRPLVEHLVDKTKLKVYDCFFHEKGKAVLWLMFMFPVFPTDIISFVTGLSDLRFREFMLIVAVGYLPNMFMLNYFGSSIYNYGLGTETIIAGSVLLTIFLFGGMFYWHLKKRTRAEKKC